MDQVAELVAKLRDRDEDVRWNAAMGLAEISDPRVIPALVDALQDTDRSVRRAAAKALGEIKDPQAVPALIEALQDPDVLGAAATALGEIKDPIAIPALMAALEESDKRMRLHPPITEETIEQYHAALNLRRFIRIDHGYVSVVRALGKFQDHRAFAGLMFALQHKDPRMAWNASVVLRRFGSSGVPALIEVLTDGDRGLRRGVAEVLGEIGDCRAVPSLVEILGQEVDRNPFSVDWDLLLTTAWALGKIASHEPVLVLRSSVPILDRLKKRDPVFQQALDQIEAATSGMKDLPLPAYAPPPDTRNLPRPAVTPDLSADDLPIPSDINTLDCPDTDVPKKSRRRWWFWREKGR